ncbi:MAG: hypothetical protein V1775_04160 [Bacteroidota bacterium]
MILLLVTLQKGAFAGDYSMNRDCLKAYELILQLKLGEARDLLRSSKKSNPENNIIPYLENYCDFLEIIISEEEELFKSHSVSRKSRIARLDEGNEKSPWHLYCLAQVNMQWAFARLKFGEYLTSAIELNRSYRQLTLNKERFPDFSPNDAALGLLHVLIGSVPDNYKWIAESLSFHGTVKQGMGEFRKIFDNPAVLTQYPFLKAESLFLLSFITFNFSASTDDSHFLQAMLENPGNKTLINESPLLIYAASTFYIHNGMNDQALYLLINRPKGNAYFPFQYLEYLTGIAKLNKLDFSARIHFLRFVVNFRGKNFIKSAYQRLAWIELLGNNPEGYNLYMDRITLIGSVDIDGDAQALAESEYPSPPDKILLKTRLLYDGGYYHEALLAIKESDPAKHATLHEKLEYKYRLARIYHKSGNLNKAITLYLEVLNQGAASPYYFAANAALQLGNINEAEVNIEKARYYYQKCLDLEYDEYKTSISQKARAGISRLRK